MKTFEEYRGELDVPNLLMSGNCCRHAFNAGQESRHGEIGRIEADCRGASIGHDVFIKQLKERHKGEIDELQNRVDQALNLIYSEKGNAERGAHSKEVSDFIFGFGYELHLILGGER